MKIKFGRGRGRKKGRRTRKIRISGVWTRGVEHLFLGTNYDLLALSDWSGSFGLAHATTVLTGNHGQQEVSA